MEILTAYMYFFHLYGIPFVLIATVFYLILKFALKRDCKISGVFCVYFFLPYLYWMFLNFLLPGKSLANLCEVYFIAITIAFLNGIRDIFFVRKQTYAEVICIVLIIVTLIYFMVPGLPE